MEILTLYPINQFTLNFAIGNEEFSTKVGVKVLSDVVIFSIVSSGIPFDFHK